MRGRRFISRAENVTDISFCDPFNSGILGMLLFLTVFKLWLCNRFETFEALFTS